MEEKDSCLIRFFSRFKSSESNEPSTTTVNYPFVYSWNVYVMLPELAVETGTTLDWSLSSFPSGL